MRPLTYLLTLTVLLLLISGCEDFQSAYQTIEDVAERVPDVQLIPGAENATVTVKYDRQRSYFNVTLGNVDESRFVRESYEGWCLQMQLPIGTNEEYTGAQLYDTHNDKIYNKLAYILNKRSAYEKANPGLSWKDIQVAFWVILETRDMNLGSIRDKLPSAVDGFNESYVDNIIKDVQTNGGAYEHNSGYTGLVIGEVDPDLQLFALEQTAWAYANDVVNGDRATSKTFDELNTFPAKAERWGWYILIFEADKEGVDVPFKFWAGAAQNDLDKGTEVGEGKISIEFNNDDSPKLKITLNMYNNEFGSFAIKDLHIHISYFDDKLPVACGQMKYDIDWSELEGWEGEAITKVELEFELDFPDREEDDWDGALYIAIHSGEIYSVR